MMEHSPYPITTDIQDAENRLKEHESAAEKAIEVIGDVLENADNFLADLESNDMLGSAIVRRCQELADVIGNLAGEIEGQSDHDKRAMAQACIEDARASQHGSTSADTNQELATLSESEMMDALSGAQALMRDVEASLRSIDSSEADEIADVALTMARIFIMSLQNMHSTLTPENLLTVDGMHTSTDRSLEFSDRIEILDDDDVEEDKKKAEETPRSKPRVKRKPVDQVRALWPPLGPAVVAAANWGKEEAAKKPLLAVALGLTLWPAAIMTTMIGTPVVLADKVVQHVYDSFSDGPLIQTVERGVAQVFYAGRLSFLSSRLVVRQTLRVASRQVKRHGGVGKLAQDMGGAILDRVTHPMETAGMAWDGICFGAGVLRDGVGFVEEAVERHRDLNNSEIIQ